MANQWVRKNLGVGLTYQEMNEQAKNIEPGSSGLRVFPFGNGAERILENKIPGASLKNLDLNNHSKAHVFRAVQEGIAAAFRYGLDIMRENGLKPMSIKAHFSNLFLSPVFQKSFVEFCQAPLSLFEGEGGFGAAIGAGIGYGHYKNPAEAFENQKPIFEILPENTSLYEPIYQDWKEKLNKELNTKAYE